MKLLAGLPAASFPMQPRLLVPGGFRGALLLALSLCILLPPSGAPGREDEIVADIAAGTVTVHVTKDSIVFATIEGAAEADSISPRVVSIDATHIGVLLGAAQWRIPASSPPTRMEKGIPRLGRPQGGPLSHAAEDSTDLEMIGEAFLETLRPLAEKLHHKIELGPEEPLLQIVVIGYAPGGYGPEVWLYDYRLVQEELRGGYFQTRVQRPRTTQLYPPEKHQPRRLVEVRYPPNAPGLSLQQKIQQNDPVIARLAISEPKFARVVEKIQAGKANGANDVDAADFLRAVVVPLAGKRRFAVGTMSENRGVDWLVPPEEPVQKAKEEKDRPPEAPTLRRKP